MKRLTTVLVFLSLFVLTVIPAVSQNLATDDDVLKNIWKEAMEDSRLEQLAYELIDVIGPRLVGTPQMKEAHDWTVEKYKSWGIEAESEEWGKWLGWERGTTHIDLLEPRVRTLEGTMLAWSPGTPKKGIKAGFIILADVADSVAFQNWLPEVKGKFVLISMPQLTGRPDANWQEYALKESFEKLKETRKTIKENWQERVKKSGYGRRTLPKALEDAGAAGVITSQWPSGWGVHRVFGAYTKKIPSLDLGVEDYGLIFRLLENGDNPVMRVVAEAKFNGEVPTFNTIAQIPGTPTATLMTK